MNDKPADADSDDILHKVKDQVQEALARPGVETPPQPDSIDKQIELSETAVKTVSILGSVDDLPPPTREESVEEARKILRWLRNMEFADRDVEQWLDASPPKVVTAKKAALQKLLHIMVVHLHNARLRNTQVKTDPSVDNAADAASAIALTMAEHTFNLLPDNHPKLAELETLIDDMSERALMRQSQSLAQLLNVIELGMERATGQEISQLSAANRLLAISGQIEKTAYQLYDTDTLEEPTREESLDLARDILRKMQNLSFGDMPVTELIETSKPGDKTAFAQAVAEMADLYRNLIAEAAIENPKILQNHNVQQANEAVGQFAYSVKLMAAKEIPSSAAATQQISADVTQMPEQWGDLHDRTVNRLMKSAEEALEKAIEELAEQQEQQEEQEQAQEAIENALQSIDSSKRRKKKRRGDSKSRSGKGGKKARKVQKDLSMDDYVLKQGRFAVDAQTARTGSDAPPIPGLNPADLAAIRALGGSLRDIGNQLKDLVTTVSSVPINSPVAPNDKTAGQRAIESELQKGPRNTGPGV